MVVAGFFQSGCVKPRLWWSLLLSAWPARDKEFSPAELVLEGHSLSFPVVVGGSVLRDVVCCWRASEDTLATACVLHAPVPVTMIPNAGCFCGYLVASYIFLFVHPCLCSQFTFVMGCKLLGHFR
jgi:hypothetical protein